MVQRSGHISYHTTCQVRHNSIIAFGHAVLVFMQAMYMYTTETAYMYMYTDYIVGVFNCTIFIVIKQLSSYGNYSSISDVWSQQVLAELCADCYCVRSAFFTIDKVVMESRL